jgi:hypothetical protein
VTDREGRFYFIVPPGSYKIAVLKAGYAHPSSFIAPGTFQDGKYVDIHVGPSITVGQEGTVSVSIPLDPIGAEKTLARVVAEGIAKRSQHAIALLTLVGVLIPVIIVPSVRSISFFAVNLLCYLFLRRISLRPKPKSWGVVRDKRTGRPLQNAITRIFDTRYNKLLETQVTDLRGRYAFLVGANVYTITFEKQGYRKDQRTPLDLKEAAKEHGEFVAIDVRLEPDEAPPTAVQEGAI